MGKLTLLQLDNVEYEDAADIERLIKFHRDMLNKATEDLKNPRTDAIISAVAYNISHLMRELQRIRRKKGKLLVLDGGKKD